MYYIKSQSSDQWVGKGQIVVQKSGFWSDDSTFFEGEVMIKCLSGLELILADLDIGDGLLMMLGNGLGNPSDLG